MAGLSDRKVITPPRAATPGKLYSGFISGRRSFSSNVTTPNSTNSLERAPVITVIPIRKNTVLSNRSCAVFIMVLIRFSLPILYPRAQQQPTSTTRNTMASIMLLFFNFFAITPCYSARSYGNNLLFQIGVGDYLLAAGDEVGKGLAF